MDVLPEGIVPSPPQNQAMKKYYPLCKASPTQKNLLQYLKSSPKRNHLGDVFDKMSLSPSKTKTTPQKTQSTHQKTQSTHQKTQSTHQKTQSTSQKTQSTSQKTQSTPQKTQSTPQKTQSTHQKTQSTHQKTQSTHQKTQSTHQKTQSTPQKTQSTPQKTQSTPQKTQSTPQKTQSTPQKTQLTPQKTQLTPQKTQSTLEYWVTPTKKMRKQIPTTPIRDVTAKRNELVWPPQHVILETDKFITRLYEKPREFPRNYKDIVESLQDEELPITIVKTILSFMSRDFAPSPEIIWYLVNNILSSSSNSWLISLTYSLLNDIIEKYPTKCIGMNITLEHVRKHFFQDKVSNDKKSLKAKCCNKLALSFLLSVLSVELKATALKSKQRRLTKYFSADFDVRHVRDVIPHLKKCLENHTATPSSCGIGERRDLVEETSICGLELFQNLLKLFIIVSVNKENSALRLADELLYLYIDLPNLQQRVLLLQSVTSHHVRKHLIDTILMNYYSLLPTALKGHNIQFLCVRKIVFQDFYREPPKRSDECGHSAEEVEEYITLLAYLLQSYVVIHSPGLHGYHNDQPLCDHDGVSEFSQDDLSCLEELNSHVLRLGERCGSFLREGQLLSLRTNVLLYMMAVVA
ncbi:Hypothetical predicted protein [Paramuricea clavata]|nr:Hypothetical predicted protein [Paramuricea clavata]